MLKWVLLQFLVVLPAQASTCYSVLGWEKYFSSQSLQFEIAEDQLPQLSVQTWLNQQNILSYLPDEFVRSGETEANMKHAKFFALGHILRVIEKDLRAQLAAESRMRNLEERAQLDRIRESFVGLKAYSTLSSLARQSQRHVGQLQEQSRALTGASAKSFQSKIEDNDRLAKVYARLAREHRILELLHVTLRMLHSHAVEHARADKIQDPLVVTIHGYSEDASQLKANPLEMAELTRHVGLSLTSYMMMHKSFKVR